jgi:uncharacterized protein (DUF362 family)
MSETRDPRPDDETAAAPATGDPADPARRKVLRRLGQAALVAGAAGAGTYALYDGEEPVRSRRQPDHAVPDHRVAVARSTPRLVIARGPDPQKNLRAALSRIGGLGPFVGKGDVVLVKPNVGWDRRPEQAANTDPELVAGVVAACRAAGAAEVIVTDCPVNNPARCFARSGIGEATRRAGGTVVLPEQSRELMVQIPGKLGRWPVLEPFVRATKVINVPIAKHHSLTRATVGMKNWYGILGGQRNRLHQRIDDSIAELAALMRPTLTVVDATRLLMRNGPTGGNPSDVKRGDALALSLDPVAADAWAVTLLGGEPTELGWLRKAQAKNLGVIDFRSLDPVELTTG